MLGTTSLAPSTNDCDWLGQGGYFWKNDPQRAQEWAEGLEKRHKLKRPAVGNAIIDLGNCLDLTIHDGAEFLEPACL